MVQFKLINMRRIFRLQLVCLFLIAGLVTYAQSGPDKSYNYFDFKKKPIYYGISLGINNSSFVVNHSKSFVLNDSISLNHPISKPGLTFQGIFNLKLGEYFDFRVLAGFSLAERSLAFYKPGEASPYFTEKIEFVYADIPFLIRYKSAPFRDKRVFAVAGLKYSYDVNGFSRSERAEDFVTVVPHDFSLEVGAGMQFFFPYFILSPEIKMSQGIGNVLSFNNELNESRVIETLLSRTFTLSFHFEG